MKSSLENLRYEIDIVDEKMIELFLKRMKLVKDVAEYKKNNSIEVTDNNREKELLLKNLSKLNSDELKEFYLIFFNSVLTSSKLYQESLLKK